MSERMLDKLQLQILATEAKRREAQEQLDSLGDGWEKQQTHWRQVIAGCDNDLQRFRRIEGYLIARTERN